MRAISIIGPTQGAQGWGYADVLPYFKRMEHWHDGGHGGDPAWRGTDGPLHITRGPRKNPLTRAFVAAGGQAGYQLTGDYNGEQQEGFGPFDATIYKGHRWSAASAYLRPALTRPNCTLTRALARRVIIEDGRAVGVEVSRGKKVEVIRANVEVIIAASALNSPKLLMLSGIGLPHIWPTMVSLSWPTGPAWGKTCRIIWNCISSRPQPSLSRFLPIGTCGARRGSGAEVAALENRPWRLQPV